jgi:hypothetical protein
LEVPAIVVLFFVRDGDSHHLVDLYVETGGEAMPGFAEETNRNKLQVAQKSWETHPRWLKWQDHIP